MINLINARIAFKVEISLSIKIFKNVCNLSLRMVGTWVSPNISWKLGVVLTWEQRQVVLHPKGSNIWKNDSFWTS